MIEVINTNTAPNLPFFYIITDDNNNILGAQNSTAGGMLDLSGAPPGTCRVWGWSAVGLPSPVVGDPLSTLMDDACENVSNEFVTVIRTSIVQDGGTISTEDNTNICVDGAPDPINVDVMGSEGSNEGWIITDDSNNILALPPAPPFDLDGAGVGTCFIWYIRYENGLTGNETGNNLSDLSGNFDLSNSITVTRETPDGGTITLADGSTSLEQCAENIIFEVAHTTTAANLSYWYIITDENNNILNFQNSTAGTTVDLTGAPSGTCRIWGWSFSGEPAPTMGDPISTLTDGDCEVISADFITVGREVPDGGVIDSDRGTDFEYCLDEGIPINATNNTTAPNLNYWYIITDEADNILIWTTDPIIDLDGSGEGTCRIWGWNFQGLPTPSVGAPITSLMDDDCEDISDNFLTVVRVNQGPSCLVNTSDLSSVDQLNIYPNPARDFLEIEYKGLENAKGEFALVDLLGKSFLEKDLNQTNDEFQIDIREVPSGVYMVRINSGNFSTVNKVVIMK